MQFENREQAGIALADLLSEFKDKQDYIVLALPRGGVPVAKVIHKKLNLPLDILLVRKLGVPKHSEFAFGALGEHEVCYINESLVRELGLSQEEIDDVIRQEKATLEQRKNIYRQGSNALDITSKNIILVDDGIATGATLKAAILALRQMSVDKIILAVPVAPIDTKYEFKNMVDAIYVVNFPEPFFAVGNHYVQFNQVSDLEVLDALR